MKFRVKWDPDAFRGLVHMWNEAGSPEAAIASFDQIEELLGEIPDK